MTDATSSILGISHFTNSRPSASTVVFTSCNCRTASGERTLAMTANRRSWGTSSRKSSIRLEPRSICCIERPVTLPPGRAREAISPVPTGSPAVAKTIGMVEVARLAANAIGVPDVAMTSTLSWINSAAISAERSARPSAQRYTMAILRPSPQPSSPSLCTKAAVHWLWEAAVLAPKNPIVGNLAEFLRPRPKRPGCRLRRAAA